MRLNQLYMKGFKSFATETKLNFNEQVIGIVGPNGSGKSNIVDAVRWVLGEQKSKDLRLEKMSDVIFNGAKNRKRSGVAHVSLSFENTKNILPTEYDNITISRFIYESGESEYRLNNVSCRLKDINTLLADTGIGSNSYAIISLGMVDDILIDKDNSRRRMFEQAAGISKYKSRKKETLNKLRSTISDLDRVEDLLYEIEKNLSDLKKQARKTQRYFKLKEEYKDLSTSLASQEISNYAADNNILDLNISKQENELSQLNTSLIRFESELQKLKAENLYKEENLSSFQKVLNGLLEKIRQSESKKEIAKENIKFNVSRLEGIEDQNKKLHHQISGLNSKTLELKENKSKLEKDLKIINDSYNKALSERESKKNQFEDAKSKDDLIRSQKISFQNKKLDFEKKIAVLNATSVSLKQAILHTESEQKMLLEELNSRKRTVSGLRSRINQNEKLVQNLEVKFLENKKQITYHVEELNRQREKISKINRQSDAIKNEIVILENMLEKLEGYPESVKFLVQHFNIGLLVLTDIISVQADYRAAVENYLEYYLNHIVVESYSEAVECINLLRSSQKGKASFLILDNFQKSSAEIPQIEKAAPIKNFVSVEPKYQQLVDHLLSKVFVTEVDLDELSRENIDAEISIVSKKGEFVKGPKYISGGSVGLFEGKRIGKRQYLDELKSEYKSLEKEKTIIQDELEKLQNAIKLLEENQIESKVQECKNEVYGLNKLEFEESTLINNLNRQIEMLGNQDENRQKELKQIEEELHQCLTALSSLDDDSIRFQPDDSRVEQNLKKLAEAYSESTLTANELNIKIIRKESELSQNVKEFDFIQNRLVELQNSYQSNIESLQKTKTELEYLSASITKLEESLVEQYNKKEAKSRELSFVEREYFSDRGSMNEKEEEIRSMNKKINQQIALINELKERKSQIVYQINSVKERLKIEFNIAQIEDVENPAYEGLSTEEIRDKLFKLKRRLENYGEINPMAVEAFEEMQERYDLIQKQRLDILDAKETLDETIMEIEHTAKKKFMEAFEKVRSNFKEVFRGLFTDDDDCDLVLMDSSSPLEARIEIIAMPKGKRPRTLSQLSGGEKTLTAIAILFSLYLLKPAPFCIFDEVDAPLDDANIQKFNKIIRNFSKHSQFIIVTHNKLTMAEVSILYGIYMQEKGVSGVSPVDLKNYQHSTVLETI